MKFNALLLAATAAMALVSVPTQASVLVNNSPDATGFVASFNASNRATGQNFLFRFTLTSAAKLTGASIYSTFGAAAVGDGVVFKLRSDAGGQPSAINLATFSSTLDAVDNLGSTANPALRRLHASFMSGVLAPGTYWGGLSGTNEIGMDIAFNGSGQLWQLSGDNNQFALGSAPFQIEGIGAVPEPATWAFMILGFGLVGGAMRSARRQTVRVTYA